MNATSKVGTEITVRISLSFQDSPNVHTLLAMTPVRERRRLIFSALERYIESTGHPAGNIENQIEEISRWLRSREIRHEKNPVNLMGSAYARTENNGVQPEFITKNDNKTEGQKSAEIARAAVRGNQGNSRSTERWLDT